MSYHTQLSTCFLSHEATQKLGFRRTKFLASCHAWQMSSGLIPGCQYRTSLRAGGRLDTGEWHVKSFVHTLALHQKVQLPVSQTFHGSFDYDNKLACNRPVPGIESSFWLQGIAWLLTGVPLLLCLGARPLCVQAATRRLITPMLVARPCCASSSRMAGHSNAAALPGV